MTVLQSKIVFAAMLFVVLAACGGDDNAVEGQTTPSVTPFATVQETGDAGAAPPSGSAEAATETADAAEQSGDGTLHIGYVLPETGPIAFLGPPQTAGLQYAVEQINEAGGVLGNEVQLTGGDEAGDEQVAGQTVDRLLADRVDAIVGAAASSISLAIIDRITGAQVVQCSGSNTGATFTDYDDDGYYFRTVPSNVLQGPVLAEQIVADGNVRVAVASRADDYGRSLGQSVVDALQEAGAEVVADASYDPAAQEFAGLAQELTAENPDAIVLISFEEGALVLRELIESGATPQEVSYYGTDGMPLPDLAEMVAPEQPDLLQGFTATGASSTFDPQFVEALQQTNPELDTTLFAPYTYDCGIIIALAAQSAGSDDPAVFADAIVDVTRDGTQCETFAECKELLEAGEDVDYVGASGPLDFIDAGEPSVGIYDILTLDENGEVQTSETVTSERVEATS